MNKTTSIIMGILLIAISFYGGMKYDQGQIVATGQIRTSGFAGGRGFGGRGGAGGGFLSGQIISADANSITLQLMGTTTSTQGSSIVLLSASTTIMKTTAGSLTDLTVGKNVTITGTKNSDGSVSANSIQLRPARQQ